MKERERINRVKCSDFGWLNVDRYVNMFVTFSKKLDKGITINNACIHWEL